MKSWKYAKLWGEKVNKIWTDYSKFTFLVEFTSEFSNFSIKLLPFCFIVSLTCLGACARARSPPRVRAREPQFRICRSFSRLRSPDENNSLDKLLRVACLEIRLHQDCDSEDRSHRGALSVVMKRKQEKLRYHIRLMTDRYKMLKAFLLQICGRSPTHQCSFVSSICCGTNGLMLTHQSLGF